MAEENFSKLLDDLSRSFRTIEDELTRGKVKAMGGITEADLSRHVAFRCNILAQNLSELSGYISGTPMGKIPVKITSGVFSDHILMKLKEK